MVLNHLRHEVHVNNISDLRFWQRWLWKLLAWCDPREPVGTDQLSPSSLLFPIETRALLAACFRWVPSYLVLRPWRWRWLVSPKSWLTTLYATRQNASIFQIFPTSQKTHLLLRYKYLLINAVLRIMAVYLENSTKHTKTLCLQNEAIPLKVIASDKYSY
jgi:hypothetical protein